MGSHDKASCGEVFGHEYFVICLMIATFKKTLKKLSGLASSRAQFDQE
jgi:hypothetical protein